MGHNGGPSLDDPLPEMPEKDPGASVRWQIIKQVARWVAPRIGLLAAEDAAGGGALGLVFDAVQIAAWIRDYAPYIEAYYDQPKSLDELVDAARQGKKTGYDIHHIVEQTPGRKAGIPNKILQAPENLARIPTLKHWQLNSWYQTPNEDYEGMTPRRYLEGKSYEVRREVGLEGLKEVGVLEP